MMSGVKNGSAAIGGALRLTLRVLWVALALLLLYLFISGVPYRFAALSEVCVQAPCTLNAMAASEAQALTEMGLSLGLYAGWHIFLESLLGGVMSLLALFLFWRSFDSAQGILVTFMLLLVGLNFMAEVDLAFVEQNPAFAVVLNLLNALVGALFVLFLFVFPDGRFAPRWGRVPYALFAVISVLEAVARPGANTPSSQYTYLFLFSFLAMLVMGFVFQVYRYRRVSTPVQRQQTKWVVVGLAAILGPILVYSMAVEIFPLAEGMPRLLFNTVGYAMLAVFILLFPVSLVISILRYRLWDVDVIIRRTLVYGVLTLTLALFYFGAVIVLQGLFHGLTGQDSTLAIVLSTLGIAALFAPLRGRIQGFFDRRFYRQNYDAAQALARFALAARDEVDLDVLTGALAGVVSDTVQPEHFSLWLRDGAG